MGTIAQFRGMNRGLKFDGSQSSLITLDDNITFADGESWTIEIVVKEDVLKDSIHLWGNSDDSSKMRLLISDTNIMGVVGQPFIYESIDRSIKNHISLTYGEGAIYLYVNGEKVGENEVIDDVYTGGINQYILINSICGCNIFDNTLNGVVYEFRAWNKTLTQEEIRHYMNGCGGNEVGLIGYWTLNEGEGTVVNDIAKGVAFKEDWYSNSYTTPHTELISCENSILKVKSLTNDSMIEMYNIGSFDPNAYRYVEMKYRITNGISSGWQIFFTNDLYSSASANQQIDGSLIEDGEWHVARIDGWSHANWKTNGGITGWRLDWATVEGVEMEIDYVQLVRDDTLVNNGTINGATWVEDANKNSILLVNEVAESIGNASVQVSEEGTKNLASGVYLGFGDRWEKTSNYPSGLSFTPKQVWKRKSNNTYWGYFNDFISSTPNPYGKTFTISCWYYLEDGYDGNVTSAFYGRLSSGASPYSTISTSTNNTFTTSTKGKWVFGQQTLKVTIDAFEYTYLKGWGGGNIADGKHCYVADVQIEEKDHATPFAEDIREPNSITLEDFSECPDCLEFDGVDDCVELTSLLEEEGTIEMWYYPDSFYDYNTLWDNSTSPNQWECWIYSNGILRSRLNGDYVSYTLPQTKNWYHIAFTWKRDNFIRLYVNGVLSEETTITNWVDPNIVYLGGSTNTKGKGKMKDVRIWNYARTQQEIKDNMSKTLSSGASGLIGHWKLDDGYGSRAYDSSSNANHGTINGASWQYSYEGEVLMNNYMKLKGELVEDIEF